MKKLILFVVLSVVTVAVVFAAYLYWAKSTFVSREIKRRTGAQEVHVLDQLHNSHQWYGKAEIDQQTGKQLLARYEWKRGFERKSHLPEGSFPTVRQTVPHASIE